MRRRAKYNAHIARLREALRDNATYPAGHDEHYSRVIRPIEEVGVRCDTCRSPIDAADVLSYMVSEGHQAGPEQVLAGGWICTECEVG